MKKSLLAKVLAGLIFLPTLALAATVTQPFSITVTVQTGVISSISLSNTSVTGGAINANATVGTVSLATNPAGGTFTGTLTLNGTNGNSFALASPAMGCVLTNPTTVTCTNATTNAPIATLKIGASNIAGGTYSITLTANG